MNSFKRYVRRPILLVFLCCVIFSVGAGQMDRESKEEDEFIEASGTISDIAANEKCDQYISGSYIIMDFSREYGLKVGDQVRIRGRLARSESMSGEQSGYGRYLMSKGYEGIIYPEAIEVTGHKSGLPQILHTLKRSFYSRTNVIFGKEESGLVKGILFGDKSGIEDETRQFFSEAGIMHVFAVSGLHVGIIYAGVIMLLKKQGDFARFFASAFVLLAYSALCTFTPSVTRASIFFMLMGIAYLSMRQYDVMCALYAVGILLLIQNPNVIYDISFQLSFAAVVSISKFYHPIRKTVKLSPAAMSIAASVLTWPIIYLNFGIVSAISPVANLLTVPLLPLVMGLSIASIGVSFLSFKIAHILSYPAEAILKYYVWISGRLCGIKYSSLEFERTSSEFVVIYYIVMAYYILYMEVKSVKEHENAAKGYEE